MLGVFTTLGCFVEWANRFGLAMKDDPKEWASSTHTEHEEEEIVEKRGIENYTTPDTTGRNNDLLGLGKDGNFGGDVNALLAAIGPRAEGNEKQQALQADTILCTVEVQRIMEITHVH